MSMTFIIIMALLGLGVWCLYSHQEKYDRALRKHLSGDSRDLAEQYENIPRWNATDRTRELAKYYRAEADRQARGDER